MAFKSWVFNECTKRETKTEDALAEFFSTLDFDRREEYLVRESFQNSNDASLQEGAQVRVRIFVSGRQRALPVETASKYFDGLLAHLEACHEIETDWSSILNQACEYVVIEDFGTTGLSGDELAGIHTEGEKNAFYHFWRTSARTDKDSSSGKAGSWGIGKFVYIMSSQLRTMFGLTIREHSDPDRRALLFGQNAIKYHTIGETIFSKHGYFGVEPDGDEVIAPYQSGEDLSDFSRDWNLERGSETGLSVVVPFAHSIDCEALLFSVVKEYGGRILQDLLVVDFDFPDLPSLRLDKNSLFPVVDSRISNSDWREVKALLSLLANQNEIKDEAYIELPLMNGSKTWVDVVFDESLISELTEKFRTFGHVYIHVPVEISRKAGKPERSHFQVLLRNEEGSEPIAPVFFRSGLRISGKQMGNKSNGVRSVFISTGGVLGEMLRLAEGPAHTEWSAERENLKNRFKNDANWIRICRNAPRKLVELARGGHSENDYEALADLFPDPDLEPDPRPPRPDPRPVTGGGGVTGGVIVDQVGELDARLSAIDGGFVLQLEESVQVHDLLVEMAYARVRGNSFSKWNQFDFDAKNLQVAIVGGKVLTREENRLKLVVSDASEFRLTVTGFDPNRDLRVRASALPGAGI